MNPEYSIGWDIGGAHVKVAVLHGDRVLEVEQHPCPLWLGVSKLEALLAQILARLPAGRLCQAVTMTGELADSFATREEGVRRILELLAARMDANSLYVFSGTAGLLKLEDLKSEHYTMAASANWLATANYVAKTVEGAVFIDIGSTTSDVLLVKTRKVLAQGYSDYERLLSRELIYTGIARTPVAALAKKALFEGRAVPLMAELFATTADVYRLTGQLPEAYDPWPAADGAEKTQEASARRLARMIGRDLHSAPLSSWIRLAGFFRETQLREIQDAVLCQLSRFDADSSPLLVGAGTGRFLAAELAARLDLPYRDFSSLVSPDGTIGGIAECAPAVSLALLLVEHLGSQDSAGNCRTRVL
ncbi:MAG: hydantoinase/oxoprolinase family protein [Gammaproteobacteria bacterium]